MSQKQRLVSHLRKLADDIEAGARACRFTTEALTDGTRYWCIQSVTINPAKNTHYKSKVNDMACHKGVNAAIAEHARQLGMADENN